MTSGARPCGADNSTATCDDGSSTSQRMHTVELLLLPNDPSHPQGKKRKLDDCED